MCALPLSFVLCVYIVWPVILMINPRLPIRLVFLHMVKWPSVLMDFSKPRNYGHKNLKSGRCFYLNVTADVRIGVWHILPECGPLPEREEDYVHTLRDGRPIFLYLHGTGGTRAHTPRVNMLKHLSSLGNHVFSIDYRGFGDSSGSPTEEGVVQDALFTYRWIKARCRESPIFIWGHSLGSGVATSLVRHLCDTDQEVGGLILEAPFNNLREEAVRHPLTLLVRRLPLFEKLFLDPVTNNNIHFSSDKHITHVKVPIMIIHSKDDGDVPIELGRKLYDTAVQSRTDDAGPVHFFALDKCGHINISQATEFPHIVRKFLKACGCGDLSDNDCCNGDQDRVQ